LRRKNLPRKRLIPAALQAAHELGKTFDDILLRQWLGFSQPAQDMAWRGFEKDEILSAAINTSQNTYVRAAGYLISEVTAIPPASIFDINESYSPFADDRFNERLHQKLVDKIFEDVIAEGLKRNSSDPFFETAERQNQELTEGRVVGWCAAALQAAARGFDTALVNGTPPAVAARREFETEKEKTAWDGLKQLGKAITKQTRSGQPVTMSALTDMMKDDSSTAAIRKSVQATIKTPGYQLRLDAVNELHARPDAKPAGPALQGPQAAPATPAALPSLGRTGRVQQQQRATGTGNAGHGTADKKDGTTGESARTE
jgi:hypothetical protein